jgi:hypothetical protein
MRSVLPEKNDMAITLKLRMVMIKWELEIKFHL